MMDLSQISNYLKIPSLIAFLLAIATGMMLWGPTWYISGLGLQQFIDDDRPYMGVGFLLILISAVAGSIQHIIKFIKQQCDTTIYVRRRRKRLYDLTTEEKQLLLQYFRNNTRTQTLDSLSGVVNGLEHDHVIYRATGLGTMNIVTRRADFDYNIQPWAWHYLRQHLYLLDEQVSCIPEHQGHEFRRI
jgi:Super-infection exclusion protein B